MYPEYYRYKDNKGGLHSIYQSNYNYRWIIDGVYHRGCTYATHKKALAELESVAPLPLKEIDHIKK